ncbi:MAG: sigma-70 family RNA polymerase sigma factor [Desulfobacterales bacterium]|jgi:RNA polymerase sigma-70 factor (ECF subfamily)
MTHSDEVYERLLRPIEGQMINTVARIVRDPEDAADVFQDVLVIVWHKLDRILCHPNPHGYILRICITRSYDALRKKMRRRRFEIRIETIKTKLWPKVSQQSPPAHNIANTIRAAISMLPPKQGQAVLLRAIEGSAYNAIADILGCGESTARSHFSKGKARLEKILQDLGI